MGANDVQECASTAQRSSMTEELSGRRIVVPETRELGQLIRMLQEYGAEAIPCPMSPFATRPRQSLSRLELSMITVQTLTHLRYRSRSAYLRGPIVTQSRHRFRR